MKRNSLFEMTFYKSLSDFQQKSFDEIDPQIGDFDQKRIKSYNIEYSDELINNIKNQFTCILLQSPEESSHTIKILNEMISTNPDICFQYILPNHIEIAIFFISKREYYENGIIFLNLVLDNYPQLSRSDNYLKFAEELYQKIAHFFSSKVIDSNIKRLQNIIFKSIYDPISRDIFIRSETMKQLENNIQKSAEDDDQNDLIIVSLEIVSFLVQIHPVPDCFKSLIYPLQEVSNLSGEESVLALNILTDLTLYSSIDILVYIKQYGIDGTTYIENLSAFLQVSNQNLKKRISSFQLLSALSKYGDEIFQEMNRLRTLFEAKKSLSDKKKEIIIEALTFFLCWYKNAKDYQKNLFDQICKFNFTAICKEESYQAKSIMMDLIISLSEKANATQLQYIINKEFIRIAVENIDETNYELSAKIIHFLNVVVDRSNAYPYFLQTIKEELTDIQIGDDLIDEQLSLLLELINNYC